MAFPIFSYRLDFFLSSAGNAFSGMCEMWG